MVYGLYGRNDDDGDDDKCDDDNDECDDDDDSYHLSVKWWLHCCIGVW